MQGGMMVMDLDGVHSIPLSECDSKEKRRGIKAISSSDDFQCTNMADFYRMTSKNIFTSAGRLPSPRLSVRLINTTHLLTASRALVFPYFNGIRCLSSPAGIFLNY